MTALRYINHDGGHAAAGFGPGSGGSIPRAISIATGIPYADVHRELLSRVVALPSSRTTVRRYIKYDSARDPLAVYTVPRPIIEAYLDERGWTWKPVMRPGQGTITHLRADELPTGWLICRISKNHVAVKNGDVYDIYDPTRDGTRCVYGYYQPSADAVQAAAAPAG